MVFLTLLLEITSSLEALSILISAFTSALIFVNFLSKVVFFAIEKIEKFK